MITSYKEACLDAIGSNYSGGTCGIISIMRSEPNTVSRREDKFNSSSKLPHV